MSMPGIAVVKPSGIFVKLAGSDIETPATTTVEVSDGDEVLANLVNRKLVITGNQTAIAGPTTDGVQAGFNESGEFEVEIGGNMGLMGASGEPVKGAFSPEMFRVYQDDSNIAVFTDGYIEFLRSLHLKMPLVIGSKVAIGQNEDGGVTMKTLAGSPASITLKNGEIHLDGDVFINDEKIEKTEEGEEQ